MRHHLAALLLLPVLCGARAHAKDEEKPVETEGSTHVEVTATRYPDDPANLPGVVTVLDGQMLRDRGMTDLRSALGVVAGVDIAQGGDQGPASSVPEMWGLREFDAFLLVVDGVPWGGAFNPELPALSLRDVARIEIMRGAAPVMYGATSFVGVIQVLHNAPGSAHAQAQVQGGTNGSYGVDVAVDVGHWLGFDSRILVDAGHQGYEDDRAEWTKAHTLWRNLRPVGKGSFRFDVDLLYLDQFPTSPAPREGSVLSDAVPLDANHNPSDAKVDPRRGTLTLGFDQPLSFGAWGVTGSYAHVKQESIRGFIEDTVYPESPALGLRQDVSLDEVYLDGHLQISSVPKWTFVTGIDALLGWADSSGGIFDYTVSPAGTAVPDSDAFASHTLVDIEDTRRFGGAYGAAAWAPGERWRLELGARYNFTHESRTATSFDVLTATTEGGDDDRTENRLSGSAGVAFTAWKSGADDVKVFAGYRNTFKPAAIDFGFDAEPEILEPEEGQSLEVGARTALLNRRLEIEAEAFTMKAKDIVIPDEEAGGVPGVENGGEQNFEGIELELRGQIMESLWARGAWSYHNATFGDFVQDFDGVPTQLDGNRVEMSPHDLAAVGAIWAPAHGLTGHAEVKYTGARFLNKRNTALAPGFTSWSAGIGWRAGKWEARVDAENIGNRRDPVAESEFADAAYYRMPPRQIWTSFRWNF
ncbi:MAG TPA: TonB-dependent receptor [Candidatus Polarisedimenticolaceae bacterium]|nr:TonB-dependent receptor [Candidatus Polarisedimenticolaceae bacterium]